MSDQDSTTNGTSKINAYTRMGPFGLVPAWVLSFDLTYAELKIYIAVRSYSNGDDSGCWPTMRKIAERANVTLGTARNAMQRMRKLGLFLSEDRYRADGSFGGFTYLLADVDPRLGDPTLGDVPKNSRSRAGTSADVPATNMDDVDHSGHGGGTPLDVPPSIKWCTPPPSSDVPIEQTKELFIEQTKTPPTPHGDQLAETTVSAGAITRGGGIFEEPNTPGECDVSAGRYQSGISDTGSDQRLSSDTGPAASSAVGACSQTEERTDREAATGRGCLSGAGVAGIIVPPAESAAGERSAGAGLQVPTGEVERELWFWERARVVLRAATRGLSPARLPSKTQGDVLIRLTGAALGRGWSEQDLTRVLGDGDLGQAKTVAGLLRHRLENLPSVPASVARRVGPAAGEVPEWRRERAPATSASAEDRMAARALAARRLVRVERPVRAVRGGAVAPSGPSASELLDLAIGDLVEGGADR